MYCLVKNARLFVSCRLYDAEYESFLLGISLVRLVRFIGNYGHTCAWIQQLWHIMWYYVQFGGLILQLIEGLVFGGRFTSKHNYLGRVQPYHESIARISAKIFVRMNQNVVTEKEIKRRLSFQYLEKKKICWEDFGAFINKIWITYSFQLLSFCWI